MTQVQFLTVILETVKDAITKDKMSINASSRLQLVVTLLEREIDIIKEKRTKK